MTTPSIQQSLLRRKLHGSQWATERGNVLITDDGRAYKVRSSSDLSKFHYVTLTPRHSCSCQDFKHHEHDLKTCKHIQAALVVERAMDAISVHGAAEMEFRYFLEKSTRKTRFQMNCWQVAYRLICEYRQIESMIKAVA